MDRASGVRPRPERSAETKVNHPGRGTPLESILEMAEAGDRLSQTEIFRLLSIVQEEDRTALFAAARRVRAKHTGNRVIAFNYQDPFTTGLR